MNRLLRRAQKFKEDATRSFEEGYYDFTCFYAEQAIQLRLKAFVLRYLGFIPRTHSIRDLLSYVYKYTNNEQIREYVEGKRKLISDLERSYTDARYGDIDYDKNDGNECLNILNEIFSLLENEESRRNIH